MPPTVFTDLADFSLGAITGGAITYLAIRLRDDLDPKRKMVTLGDLMLDAYGRLRTR